MDEIIVLYLRSIARSARTDERVRLCNVMLCFKLAHFGSLKSLCLDVVCMNFSSYIRKDPDTLHLGLPDTLWKQLLPHFEKNTRTRLGNFYLGKPAKLVEFLVQLIDTADCFNFERLLLTLGSFEENKLWDALQRKATCLKYLIVPYTAIPSMDEVVARNRDHPSSPYHLLSAIPRRLEIICSLRTLQFLYLPFWHVLDETALTAIGNNLIDLSYLNCSLLNEGITIEALNQFFSKLDQLQDFHCNNDFVHLKSLLNLNHRLLVAGIEAGSKLVSCHRLMHEQETGHFAHDLRNPIPLEHLVLYKETLGRKMEMLPAVRHLKLVGWPQDPKMNDTLWRNLLDFRYLESLHFHNTNSIYLEFLEKFGPGLKGLSLVNVTDGPQGALPMDQILRLCPRLETLLIADGYDPKVGAGTLPLPPVKHLKKLAIVGNYCVSGQRLSKASIELSSQLLVHLLSSPKLRELYLEFVNVRSKLRRADNPIDAVACKLEELASAGKVFQKLKIMRSDFNNDFAPALLHAPKYQGHQCDYHHSLFRFY